MDEAAPAESSGSGGDLLSASDLLSIHRLLAWYGHVLDERRWDDLDELFTADAVFDASAFPGRRPLASLEQIRAMVVSAEAGHPLAHHATNVVITATSPDTACVKSKGVHPREDGTWISTVYLDEVSRTPRGWRFDRRVITPCPTSDTAP